MPTSRKWTGRWIRGVFPPVAPSTLPPAPYIRKTFTLDAAPAQATAFVCAPGWHECHVNGQKVDDRVLAPVVSQFDRHVSYIAYDIAHLLKPGKNAIVLILGNGLYNCTTEEVWNFAHAYWRDTPKCACDIVVDGVTVAATDDSWKTAPSPVIFDAIRNGERYNCNCEIPGALDADFDDSAWRNATRCNPPGGIPILEECEPCRVCQRIKPVSIRQIADHRWVADFGVNLTGWCEITLKATDKTSRTVDVRTLHTERLDELGEPFLNNINSYIKSGECQTDHVVLKPGPGITTFHPHFTYHGFRYATVTIDDYSVAIDQPTVSILDITACFVHTDFPQTGHFTSSDDMLNKLQDATIQSYLCNFTGIPTDCPHREKNGWTGDTNLALQTGMWNFNGAKAYHNFMQVFVDTQRPNGQFPGIAPAAGWGYNWGNGPVWDTLIFEAAWQLVAFRDDWSVINDFYPAMRLYLDYCESMAVDDLTDFGLGDWVPVHASHAPTTRFTSSAFEYLAASRFAAIARKLGRTDDAEFAENLATRIRNAVRKTFDNGDGTWVRDEWTSLAGVLYCHFCDDDKAQALADRLAAKVRANGCKADFGIVGAKWTPRVLADYGHADEAYQLIAQPEFPGWGYWIRQGATTLWENWRGTSSQCHIMFGDISAWMYEYLAGVKPDFRTPGFRHFTIQPCFVKGLDHVDMSYDAPMGTIRSAWKRTGDAIACQFEIPAGATADIILPGKTLKNATGRISEIVQ